MKSTVARVERASTLLCGGRMIRVPERLAGEDVIDAKSGEERAQVLRGLLHPGFFRDFVAEQDESLGATFSNGIADVLDGLPLAGFRPR